MSVESHGKEVYNAYTTLKMRERNQRRKQRAVEYKGGRCERCGYDKCLDALDFHHRDPDEKDFQVSKASRSWKVTKAELDKCHLLCANCHREEHHRIVSERHKHLQSLVVGIPRRNIQRKVTKFCPHCGDPFEHYGSRSQKFCSERCRWDSQRVWPSDQELAQMLDTSTPSQVAKKLGLTPKTVRKRCRDHDIEWKH